MAQLFPRYVNTLFWSALVLVLISLAGFFPVRSLIENSSYVTNVGLVVTQPVPFSHKHHVGDLKINCRYCHSSVEKSSSAGFPSTETCMGCHTKLWSNADLLAPVRASLANNTRLQWNRVYNIPDYVFFNHSIHIAKGVGCESCHGRIDQMPLTFAVKAFHMEECLECHRHPERYIRPREEIYNFGWHPRYQEKLGRSLMQQYRVATTHLTECVTCHR